MDIKKDIIAFIEEGHSLEVIIKYYGDESFSATEGWQEIIKNFYQEI